MKNSLKVKCYAENQLLSSKLPIPFFLKGDGLKLPA